MHSDVNLVLLSGRLASDGELTVLANEPVLRLKVNSNEDTFSAEVRGPNAREYAKAMVRGAAVVLTGRIHCEKVGEHHASRYYHVVRVSEISHIGAGESRQRSLMATEPDK